MSRITVVGDGAWGTALALHLCRNGHTVRGWGPFEAPLRAMRASGENRRFLPGIPLPRDLHWTAELPEALHEAEWVVLAVPSRFYTGTVTRMAGHMPAGVPLVSVTKGLEPETGRRMTEVARAALAHHPITALSGPSFAEEVARRLPTAVVAASKDVSTAEAVQTLFSSAAFRVYTTDDIIGVELGGVLKNVIAIAAGASDALGFGTNARAALITRGLAEITRLGAAMGAHPATFSGLSGMGDLVLTCTGPLSRNRRVGERIGAGERIESILDGMEQVAEGVVNCATARMLARKHAVDAPIVDTVYRVLYEGLPPRDAVSALMGREPGPERARERKQRKGER